MEFILGLVIIALDIWAIINVVQSPAGTPSKVLWALGIVIFPVLGFLVWLFAGPRGSTAVRA